MTLHSIPRTTQDPGDPTTRLEESVVLFDRDLVTLGLSALLAEEGRLRRLASGHRAPNAALAIRIAAIEHALARGGAR